VRSEQAVVWTATFAGERARLEAMDRLEASPSWSEMVSELNTWTHGTQVRRLEPTARSEHPGCGRH
jgi:hypothetical protein